MMKSKLILLTFVIATTLIRAQGKINEDYSITKKINVSNNYNTGKVDIAIPLYSIDLGETQFNSNLSYQQEIIRGEPSLTGTNWDINTFGKIIISYSEQNQFLPPFSPLNGVHDGYNDPHHASIGVGMPKESCITTDISSYSKYHLLNNPSSFTKVYNPNTFYFDFFGYTGYMIFDNAGKFLINCENGNLQAEYYGEKCFNLYGNITNIPQIVIKDDKGNKFYFGGDYNSVDMYYGKTKFTSNMYGAINPTNFYTNTHTTYISSFSLKKVVLSNGRIIEAFYKQSNRTIMDPFMNGGIYYNADYPNGIPSKTDLMNNNIFLGVDEAKEFDSHGQTGFANGILIEKITDVTIYQKMAVLDSIQFSDYGSAYYTYTHATNSLTKPFLTNITLKAFNKNINQINFNYLTLNNSTYLESFSNNQDQFAFTYYTDFGPQPQTSIGGLLKSVVYPTKGTKEFFYEQNRISKIVGHSVTNNQEQYFVSNVNLTGDGFRVKAINARNGSENYRKNYYYKNNDGTNSGIAPIPEPSGSSSYNFSSNSSTSISFLGRYNDNIRYSTVTEEVEGKGKEVYYFTDLLTNPDSIATKSISSNTSLGTSNTLFRILKNKERGKLYKLEKYDKDNTLVYWQETKFTNFLNNVWPINQVNNNCTSCKISDDRFYVPVRNNSYQYQPVLPYLPQSIRTWEKRGDNLSSIVENVKYFKYNTAYQYWHSMPIEEKEEAFGRINISKFYFPGDILRSNPSCITGNCPSDSDLVGQKFTIYKEMFLNNINLPIVSVYTNDLGKSSLTENIFKKNSSSSDILRNDKKRISLLTSSFSTNNYTQAEVIDDIKYDQYDSKGNLQQYTTKDGISTSIIWGYKKTQPIAKIVGATYAQVQSLVTNIINNSDADVDIDTEQKLIKSLDSLRKDSNLSHYQVTTYTYDPLIGMTSVTPPSGIRESYRYNSINKLEKIVDINGNIVKDYNYHYTPVKYFNTAKSEGFVRNNCGYDAYGSTYNYIVPANKYMSLNSQADADYQAQNEINLNGQNTANIYGVCDSPAFCSFMPENDINDVTSTIERLSDIKVKVQINIPISINGLNSFNSSLPLQGFFIGEIADGCQLISNSNQLIAIENGRKWIVTMGINGSIFIKLIEGGISPSSISAGSINLNFEYNINDSNSI